MSLLPGNLEKTENYSCKITEEPDTSELMCYSDTPLMCYSDTPTDADVAQLFITENKAHDKDPVINSNLNPDDNDQLSECDEDSFEDIWDDFDLAKPKQKCAKQNEKAKRKDLKQQMRVKSMVRYKSSTTAEFDEQTKFLLQRLVVARYMNHYFDIAGAGSHSIVITGKSSSLYSMPTRVVVKIYENSENSKALYRKVQNEYHILGKIYRCHINGPKPACAWRNIIIMAAIGEGGTAPSINMAPSQHDYKNYFEIIDQMRKMFQTAKVVHGNLSPRTILWFDKHPYFIGWSHAVPVVHPKAMNLLIKDCLSVTSLFQDKLNVGVKTTEELFKFITDLPEIEHELLQFLDNIKTSGINNTNLPSTNISVNYTHILEYCAKLHR